MSEGWLWVLSSDGVPYRIHVVDKPETEHEVRWHREEVNCPVRELAATTDYAFALDTQATLHLYVKPSLIAVRRRKVFYQNQRWYPVIGWSRTLPSDRNELSEEDGRPVSEGTLCLPSTAWRWEEPWCIQVDELHDKEGWEYAFNFGMKWKNSEKGGYVRRRKKKRHMRYGAVGRWTELAAPQPLICIAAGCHSASNDATLFAVGNDGSIYRRIGISRDEPEGTDWLLIDDVISKDGEREDVMWLSCRGISLIVATWDGTLYSRNGITLDNPLGTCWSSLATPLSLPVTAASLGLGSLWISTSEGKIWCAQLPSRGGLSALTADSYVNLGACGCKPSLSLNDQLFCVSHGGSDILFREGISNEELAGKRFCQLVQRTGESENPMWSQVIASGCMMTSSVPLHWKEQNYRLNSNGTIGHLDTEWRRKIMESLESVEQHNWEVFRATGEEQGPNDNSGKEKKSLIRSGSARVKQLSGPRTSFRIGSYVDCQLRLTDSQLDLIKVGGASTRWLIDQLLLVESSFDSAPFAFCIDVHLSSNTVYRVSFSSEDIRDSWHDAIHRLVLSCVVRCPRSSVFHRGWSVGRTGNIRCHLLDELASSSKDEKKQNPTVKSPEAIRGVACPGRFQKISAGALRIVWAMTEIGGAYALDPSWNPLEVTSSRREFPLMDEKVMKRRALLRGFISFSGQSGGISSWMDGEGGHVTGKYSRLPNRNWSWIDSEWNLDCDWEYAEKATGPFTIPENRAKFRRRVWSRKARYCEKGPWMKVEGPEMTEIRVQKKEDERILVWAVTKHGEVLVRQGVSAKKPCGTAWKQILCDYPISCLSVASPTCVWAISTEGRVLYRQCTQQTDMECVDWQHLYQLVNNVTAPHSLAITSSLLWIVNHDALYMLNIQTKEEHCLRVVGKWASVDVDCNQRVYVSEETQTVRQGDWVKRVPPRGKGNAFYECSRQDTVAAAGGRCFSVV